jgi:hypothetical protein
MKIINKQNSKLAIFSLAGLLTTAGFIVKKKMDNKRKVVNDESIMNLVQATKELKNNLNHEKVREYIETVDNIDLNTSNLWIIKEGYDLIWGDKNINGDLKKDLKLILEMKGVKMCYKYE